MTAWPSRATPVRVRHRPRAAMASGLPSAEQVFLALADPTRRQMLERLADGPATITALHARADRAADHPAGGEQTPPGPGGRRSGHRPETRPGAALYPGARRPRLRDRLADRDRGSLEPADRGAAKVGGERPHPLPPLHCGGEGRPACAVSGTSALLPLPLAAAGEGGGGLGGRLRRTTKGPTDVNQRTASECHSRHSRVTASVDAQVVGEIRHSVFVRAEAERVYDAMTTAEGLDGWLPAGRCRIRGRAGMMIWRWRTGAGSSTRGATVPVGEAERPRRIVFGWDGEGAPDEGGEPDLTRSRSISRSTVGRRSICGTTATGIRRPAAGPTSTARSGGARRWPS